MWDEKTKDRKLGIICKKGQKEKRPQRREQSGRKSSTPTKRGTQFKNKKELSSEVEVEQDAKLEESLRHINQEVNGDLFKSSFTIMVSVEFI